LEEAGEVGGAVGIDLQAPALDAAGAEGDAPDVPAAQFLLLVGRAHLPADLPAVVFGHAAVDSEQQVPIRAGEVPALVDREKRAAVAFQPILGPQGGQRATREAVNVQDDQNIDFARLSRSQRV
jgi:hypothetical protein